MGFASDFKAFVNKGNVLDLAVGVIIGGAFGKIVDSVVSDLIMPVISSLTGGLDFSNYFIALDNKQYPTLAEAKKATAVFAYGNFLTVAINFVLLAFCVFLLVKFFKSLQKDEPAPAPAAPAAPPADIVLLTEIRDLLKQK